MGEAEACGREEAGQRGLVEPAGAAVRAAPAKCRCQGLWWSAGVEKAVVKRAVVKGTRGHC